MTHSRSTRFSQRTRIAAIALLTILVGCAVESGDGMTGDTSSPLITRPPVTLPPVTLPTGPIIVQPPIKFSPADPVFAIHAAGNMCLDAGAAAEWTIGKPITLYWCNGTAAQQFAVRELVNAGHDVNILVGSYCVGVHGGHVLEGMGLELQTCNSGEAQEFALDGDAILSGGSTRPVTAFTIGGGVVLPIPAYPIKRTFVWRPQNDVTNIKTPIVVGRRQFTLNEELRFQSADGTGRDPHSGFAHPIDGPSLLSAIASATYGSVVELADVTYEIPQQAHVIPEAGTTMEAPELQVPAGVTVRGERRLTDNGPRVLFPHESGLPIFSINQDDVRFTGFRIEGPSDTTDDASDHPSFGINTSGSKRITIDHLEASKFIYAAIRVIGTEADGKPAGSTWQEMCANDTFITSLPSQPARSATVNVLRNFIHQNEGGGKGYGVDVTAGAYAWIDGNTEYMNRHSVTEDGQPQTGYVAEDNLILSNHPTYGLGTDGVWDFDVHGTIPTCSILAPLHESDSCFKGGIAGDHSEMRYNTFLATDHDVIDIRGVPCRTSTIDGNVFLAGSDRINTLNILGNTTDTPTHVDITTNNWFEASNPTDKLATADVDGDGIDDLFMTTGVGWWYSSGAQSEWRFLRRNEESVDQIRLGDLDGDGRADAIRVGQGNTLDVSWGCLSNWTTLTATPSAEPITSYVIGNFDGDRLHGDDIFVTTTTGGQWWVAPSGRGFANVGSSGFPMSSLRFGDMDSDGITDVVSISGGMLSFSSAARHIWSSLGLALSTMDGIFVADLDGDGIADAAKYAALPTSPVPTLTLLVSAQGRSTFASFPVNTPHAALGRFQGGRKIERVTWRDHLLDLTSDLGGAPSLVSRQDMR